MPQSLSRVLVHGVFSTKDRNPSLSEEIQSRLYPYISGILKGEGHHPIIVGGHLDHVHLLFGLSRTQTIAKTIEIVKLSSSRWLGDAGLRDFYWQGGYGMFSVSEKEVPRVVEYISNQHVHHQKVSFQDELRQLFAEHGIEFDERYVWD